MTDITIPPEALEAGKDAAFSWLRSYMEDDVRVREMTDEELTELVSAACLAMLNAWMGTKPIWREIQVPDDSDEVRYMLKKTAIILPLPKESSNAET